MPKFTASVARLRIQFDDPLKIGDFRLRMPLATFDQRKIVERARVVWMQLQRFLQTRPR